MIIVKEVTSKKMLNKFINFPISLYKDCPNFTPYIYEDEISNLKRKNNPNSKYCSYKLFLAYDNKKIVGRICAIINRYSNEKYNQKRIRFNRIDMIDDIEVTKALIKKVEEYGKENGLNEICGPLGFSDQDKEGMLTKGFDKLNSFMTFYTYPYYPKHLEQLGFVADATWKEKQIFIPKIIDKKIERLASIVKDRFKLHLQKFKSKRELKKEIIVEVLKLVNKCYGNLYGYVPIDEDQMMSLASQYIPLVNLHYFQVVRDENEKIVAIGLMIPSPVKALKRHNGHLFPFGFLSFLYELKHSKILDMLLIAVEPSYQNKGIVSIIFEDAIKHAIEDKIEYAETGPMLINNYKIHNLWKRFDQLDHKERVCFLKRIV